jgi:hypothetical protein
VYPYPLVAVSRCESARAPRRAGRRLLALAAPPRARPRRRVLVVARTLRGAAAIDVCCGRLYTTSTINIANAPASLFTFLLFLPSSALLLQHAPVDP